MRRVKDERGVAAVVVALVLVVLVGFTALAVDVGSLWWDRKELQNGADAAALALAQSCAKDACEADEMGMATKYAKGNKADSNVRVVDISHATNSVTVTVDSARAHWFAPVLGHSSSTVSAKATAAWGSINSAKVLPLTVSLCHVLKAEPGKSITLPLKGPLIDCVEGGVPHNIPGGFGWLTAGAGCLVDTKIGDWAPSDTGNDGPDKKFCSDDLKNLEGTDVLVPVFDQATGTGSGGGNGGGQYHLIGYAAIRIETYCFNKGNGWVSDGDECSGSTRRIVGTFIKMVDLGGTLGPGGGYGVTTIKLTA